MSETSIKIREEVQKLNPSAIVELFELDTRNYTGGSILRFHTGTNQLNDYIVWNGNEYVPFPIQIDGFEWKSTGTLPRPKASIANVTGIISESLRSMDDLIGSKLTRIRTFVKYLDSVNFPGGVNPTADPTAEFSRDIFFINRKVNENKYSVEFELASMIDVQGINIPRRVAIANVCMWKYRGSECGYTGGAVADYNDQLTTVLANDSCGKRLSSCKLRFPNNNDQAGLPFGGFPGVSMIRQ